MITLDRYKQNLRIIGNDVYSYSTHVATIHQDKLLQHGWWSVTTQKHINYVANEYNLVIEKNYNQVKANTDIRNESW